MYEFLTATANLPFAVALAMMLGLVVLELLGFLTGLGVSDFLDGLLPEFGDVDADADGLSLVDRFAGWLLFGKVPALILFAVFLTVFGFFGLALQGVLLTLTGFMLPGWLAALAVFPLSLPLVRWTGLGIARVLPRDETQVASRRSLLGHVGTIVIGSARRGFPAQAKVRDDVGQTQYVMVEPELADDAFHAGDAVLLKSQNGAVFGVVRPEHPELATDP